MSLESNDILMQLLNDNEIIDAPTTTELAGRWHQVVVCISENHYATLSVDNNSYRELLKLTGQGEHECVFTEISKARYWEVVRVLGLHIKLKMIMGILKR